LFFTRGFGTVIHVAARRLLASPAHCPMPRVLSLPLLVITSALLTCGCQSRPHEIQPKGEATAALATDGTKRTELQAKWANTIVITLPPHDPSHQWHIAQHDSRYLKQLTAVIPPTIAGSGPTISFLALQSTPGRSIRVRFVLLPVNAGREAVPIDGHDLLIAIE
jgi:hypothetical protein